MSYDCKVDLEGINNTHLTTNRDTILNTTGYIIDPLPSGAKDDIISSGPSSSSSTSISSQSSTHLATLHETELKDRVAIITSGGEDGEKTREMKLRSCWECCKNTYYATLCALLILIGCPMAAVGSQEGVNWALYIGIVMVLCAFLISLLAPNVRHLVKFAARHRLGEHARGFSLRTKRAKINVKESSLPT